MRSAPRSRFLLPAGLRIWVCACALSGQAAHAQEAPRAAATEPAAPLRASRALSEALPTGTQQPPTFIFGERVSGQAEVKTTVEGRAELRRPGTWLRADRLEFEQAQQRVSTEGQVRLHHQGQRFVGKELQLRLDTFEGFFSQPQYEFRGGGNGQAERIDFQGENRLTAHRATYTSCERDNEESWKPAWELHAERLTFDMGAEVAVAYKPVVRFQNVPILAWGGSVSFPLSEKRKSGVLPATYALDTASGLSLAVPYYLDVAPNRDATFTPTFMSRRGVDLGAEVRYLDRHYQGMFKGNLLPSDRVFGQERWSLSLQHAGRLPEPVADGSLSYNLNINRVSDNEYWRDFPRINKTLTQRLLPQDALLSWSRGAGSMSLRTLSWQTLQLSDSVITPPYDRLPQLTARYGLSDVPVAGLGGIDWSVDADFTRFQGARQLTSQTNGERLVTRAQVSRPWVSPAGYITPRLQLHATQYNFAEDWQGQRSANRVVPTFSLDSGLQFERETRFGGRNFLQTLEPRAFYVYTPYRDQRRLPNYDSAENSFNFASIFVENSFVGQDRIADANLVTLGLVSRLLEPSTGAESLRLGVAQRLRFADPQVTLSGDPSGVDAERLSDLLVGATMNWSQQWALNFHTQYNPELGQSKRSAMSVRYRSGAYRVFSTTYRRQQALTPSDVGSQQVDLSWQWPLKDIGSFSSAQESATRTQTDRRWYGVGRLNYSVLDQRLVDGVIGFEYDGCCWVGRVVLQRSTSGLASANTQIMAQLEFVGFSRIGNNPLTTLRAHVPGYQMLREQVSPPSRFSNYE